MKNDFDVLVIGGGAGGLFAASAANTLGAKTCLVEKNRLGGDCTWFGCMPSKALLRSASVANLIKRHAKFGLGIQEKIQLNTDKALMYVKEVVDEISTHHPAEVFEKRGIKVIFAPPQFIDKNTIELNDKRISSKRFIICTGSHPAIPPIEGLKDLGYLTNENVFELNKLPQSLIVLGGGPIGIELSQALNRLGVKIYIVEMMDRILFREDRDAAQVLENRLKEEGIQILTGKKAVKFNKKDGMANVTLESRDKAQETITAENVLVAVGRAPNLEGLYLEKAGVETTKQGIKVNGYLQTTNKNIFACGDVVGPYLFTHVAAYQAQVSVRNALFKRIAWQKVNYNNITWTIFTEPEIARLGMTEEEAKKQYGDIKVYKTEYSNADRAITDGEKKGLVKVIINKRGYIVGAHIAGAEAGEIIQGFLIAKSLNIAFARIAQVLFPYPTLSELIKKTAAKPLLAKMDNPFIKFALRLFKNI